MIIVDFVNTFKKCIPVSEAAVERCFNIHKRVHSAYRASLSDSIVEDILFLRYNSNDLFGLNPIVEENEFIDLEEVE